MGDEGLIPIGDEQAKLGQELIKAARDAGSYFAGTLGDLPKDLLGLLVGGPGRRSALRGLRRFGRGRVSVCERGGR
jgi:hypothetical protein